MYTGFGTNNGKVNTPYTACWVWILEVQKLRQTSHPSLLSMFTTSTQLAPMTTFVPAAAAAAGAAATALVKCRVAMMFYLYGKLLGVHQRSASVTTLPSQSTGRPWQSKAKRSKAKQSKAKQR